MLAPGQILNLLIPLGMVAIGAWLFYLNPRHPGTATFAALLLIRGASNTDDFVGHAIWGWVDPVTEALLPFALVAFLFSYPQPRGVFARSGWPWVALVGAAIALALFVLWNPALVEYPSGSGVPGDIRSGPLDPFVALQYAGFGLVALVLAHDATRLDTQSPLRRSALLASLGFALDSAFGGARNVMRQLGGADFGIDPAMRISGFLLVVAAIALLIARRERLAGAFAIATTLAALTGVLPLDLVPVAPGVNAFNLFFVVWKLSIPLLVTYALLRHRLFDIDIKVKWTINRGALTAIFVLFFVIVTQVAQGYLSDQYGLLAGGVATGLLFFGLTPLQRFAERFANAAMPGVVDLSRASAESKRAAYRMAVLMAASDGVVTPQEERGLAMLAEELGIGHVEALEIRDATVQPEARSVTMSE